VPIVDGVFHLTLVYNTGIAFGFLREHGTVLLVLITASLLLLFAWGMKSPESSRTARTGLGLILGGAVGNWIDRLRVGAVIDFLDFRVWPVFNFADAAISVGVGLYLIFLLRPRTSEKEMPFR
jgi:signal peptidase II